MEISKRFLSVLLAGVLVIPQGIMVCGEELTDGAAIEIAAEETMAEESVLDVTDFLPEEELASVEEAEVPVEDILSAVPVDEELNDELDQVGAAAVITGYYNSSMGGDIRWRKVAGATGYVLYRNRKADGLRKVATINNPDTLQYIDGGIRDNCWGRVYTYYVCPLYGSTEGPKSETVTLQRLAPMRFTNYTSPAPGQVSLTWACTVSANKALGYEIQYATSKTDLYNQKGSFRAISADGRNNLSKMITGLANGQTYYFRNRCYVNYTHSITKRTTKTWSQYSDVVAVTVRKPEISGRWVGDTFVQTNGTLLKGGVYNIGGKNYFFNAAGNNIRMPNSMQIITASRTPKINNAYYIKSNGEAAVNEWCNVSTCWGQDGYWQGYFRSLRKAYFNQDGMLDLSKTPDDVFNWTTVEVTNDSSKSDGVKVVREGYWTLTPVSGKTAYYQWVCKNATTNLEECRTVMSTTGTVKNIAFGMGYDYNPWCLRYMNCTITRQNRYE